MKRLVISFPIEDDDRADRMEALLRMGPPPVVDLFKQMLAEGKQPTVHVETDLIEQQTFAPGEPKASTSCEPTAEQLRWLQEGLSRVNPPPEIYGNF